MPDHEPAVSDPAAPAHAEHWRSTVRLTVALLLLWALAGLGCGVLFVDWLDQFRLGGFPLGFWFAQQGSILLFVALILVYALAMARLDRRHRQAVRRLRGEAEGRR